MFKVKFVGGGEYVSESGEPISVYDAAKAAGLISRDVIAAVKNGENVDLTHEISSDCEIKLATLPDPQGRKRLTTRQKPIRRRL